MISFIRAERSVKKMADYVNWVAAAAVTFIMLLTTLDVICRFFRHPIPGTYELVALSGSIVIAFALPFTTVQKGHIAVEFLMMRMPRGVRIIVNIINDVIALLLFGALAWQSGIYAGQVRASGEVSATLQMSIYPFIYGVAIGCALLCVVLLMDLISQFRGAEIG